MRTHLGWFLTVGALFALPVAPAAAANDVAVWFTSEECDSKFEPGTPGSTVELAIKVSYFDDPFDEAVKSNASEEDKPAKPSRFDCRWVELDGFLTWMDYYHYRGRLFASAWEAYRGKGASYIVERFADPAARRSQLVQRRITIVGRFYDLCAAASRAEAKSNDNWFMLFGPCHYGADNGMMLTDVVVKAVHDDAPEYILGDANRKIFNDLFPVEGAVRAPLIDAVRAWAAAVKRGPVSYATDVIAANPALAKDKDEAKETREYIESPDSYTSYLSELPRFRALNTASASVEVFWSASNRESHYEAIGCICLSDRCTDKWPAREADADNFLGDAACISLTKSGGTTGTWLWN